MVAVTGRLFLGRSRVILFAIVVAAALYLLAVAPVRTYFSQRHQMSQQETRLQILSDANNAMNKRVNDLNSTSEVQTLARQQYELVPPGQLAYAVMPPSKADTPTQTTIATPAKQKESLVDRAWDDMTFWN